MNWTEGRALIGTGSPFEPVRVDGKEVHIAQTNNSYIFPGLALGIVASKARRVTDAMVKAAAEELVRHLPTRTDKNASLLPPIFKTRELAREIGEGGGETGHQGRAGTDRRSGFAPRARSQYLESRVRSLCAQTEIYRPS